jgi:pimeloyl-ACP methyl ester carboxylesterase
LEGTWEGTIKVAGQELATRFNFTADGGTVDFPTQGANGIEMENFQADGASFSFSVLPAPQTASFEGELQGDALSGKFMQAGYEGTFSATRGVAQTATAEPKEYKEEEVTFKNGDVTLAGTLSLPNAAAPHPAMVLISGSGAQNRDEEIFGFKPFAILADELTKAGIAVLRYDDRGIGGSSKGTADDTSETFAGDVRAAMDYLATRQDIDAAKIGLLGHSEGGIIAPLVAVETGKPAFLVLFAGPGIAGSELLVEQAVAVAASGGMSDAEVERVRTQQQAVVDAVVSGEGLDELRADLIEQYRAAADKLPAQQKQALGDLDKWAEATVDTAFAQLQSPWMKFFLTHDPAATLEKVTVPVLAMFGEKDVQVPPEFNVEPLKAALEKAGNEDVSVTVIPDANHLFQAAKTGSPDEYTTLPKEFAPGVIDTIVGWVTERVK